MEDKIVTITTKINTEALLQSVIRENPTTECEFNNLLAANFVRLFMDDTMRRLDNNMSAGGAATYMRKYRPRCTRVTRRRSEKTRKNRQRKRSRYVRQRGGFDARIIFFFLTFFITFVKGMQNMTHTDVTNRVKQAYSVIEIFRNKYGSCTLNTMLFLKTIDLPTFEQLYYQVIERKHGLTAREMAPHLTGDIDIGVEWYSFSVSERYEIDIAIDMYIEKIRKKMMDVRQYSGFRDDQDLLTVLNYPSKGAETYHAVVAWLTNKNDVVIIDPQTYITNGRILLYTSQRFIYKYMDEDKALTLSPIRTYIRDRIDFTDEGKETMLMISMHVEINENEGYNLLSPTNQELIQTVKRIRNAEYSMENKNVVEEF